MGWYDRGGKLLETIRPPGGFQPMLSPDGKWLTFIAGPSPNGNAWVRDLTRSVEQRLTAGALGDGPAVWSPQGDRLVFAASREGVTDDLYLKAAGGTGQDELLLANRHPKSPTQWSRDGRFVVYDEGDPKTRRDIWVLPMDGVKERKPVPFLRSEFSEFLGQLSPDSHWMAYTSDEAGQREVYVRPFPLGERQWRISLAGGEKPRWRGDGKELLFMAADAKMMAVAVKVAAGTKASFEPGVPQPLFEAHLAQLPSANTFEYDVTADGKRFLLNTVGATPMPQLIVVSNWYAGLQKINFRPN
jgi:Tol biopolymer transport system component